MTPSTIETNVLSPAAAKEFHSQSQNWGSLITCQ
jgi:hypothetical protein